MDEVFTSMMPVPDLSCPPPGWGGHGANMRPYRGRGSEGSHPTRVFKRTDQRPRGGQQRSHYQQQQRPPRFSNLNDRFSNLHEDVPDPVKTRRSSWGDVWRPDVDVVEVDASKVTGEVMEGREESSSDEGEWKEVKKGRRGGIKEDPKKMNSSKSSPPTNTTSYRRKTPEPQPLLQTQNTKRRSPNISNRKSPDQRQFNNKDRSRRSPVQNSGKHSPEDLRKKLDRRGSSSSYEGSEALSREQRSSKSASSNQSSEDLSASSPPNHEELMKRIPQMMMVSDLPDEKLARTKMFTRRLSETEMMIKREEEKMKIQDEILNFLKVTWSEIRAELLESENHWPSKICYFKC